MSAAENQDYSEASTRSPQAPAGPEGPQEPSMEGVERELEQGSSQSRDLSNLSEKDLSEYDESYIQLGDYETEVIPPEVLEKAYGDAEIDGIISHGDLTKVKFEPEEYAEKTFQSYLNLNESAEAADTTAYLLSGNNDPDLSELLSGREEDGFEKGGRPSEEQIEALEQYLQEKFGDHDEWIYDEEKDPHTNLVENLDNLVDARYSEVGNDLDLIFMGNHFNPELDEQAYKAIYEGPEVDDLYEEQELDEVVSYLEDERSKSYGILGDIPLIGRIFRYIGRESVDAEELTLDEIWDEASEDFISEKHENYREVLEELKEENSDEIEAFEEAVESLTSRIEAAENPAVINHSVPYEMNGDSRSNGDLVLREALKRQGSEIEFVSGGHEHSPGITEIEGVDVVNSANRVTEIGINQGEVEYTVNSNFGGRVKGDQKSLEEMDEEELKEAQSNLDEGIERVDNLIENPGLEKEVVKDLKQRKSLMEERMEEIQNRL